VRSVNRRHLACAMCEGLRLGEQRKLPRWEMILAYVSKARRLVEAGHGAKKLTQSPSLTLLAYSPDNPHRDLPVTRYLPSREFCCCCRGRLNDDRHKSKDALYRIVIDTFTVFFVYNSPNSQAVRDSHLLDSNRTLPYKNINYNGSSLFRY
jgi:hypothetical protein